LLAQLALQLGNPCAGHARHLDNLGAAAALEPCEVGLRPLQVHLVGHDQAWFLRQRRIVELQLAQQRRMIVAGGALVAAGHVEQDHQQPAALDVAQKTVPQPAVLAGAGDQPRDVRDLQPVRLAGIIAGFADADLRLQRGERI